VTTPPDAPSVPPVPVQSEIYLRAQRDKNCVDFAELAYRPADWPETFTPFRYPPDAVVDRAILVAFACLHEGRTFIVFRGTDNWPNKLSDFNLLPAGRPRRHLGFLKCWNRLKPQVEQWLRENRPEGIILTGHSLGAALAQVAAIDLCERWRIDAVIGFGAPLVGWRRFAAAYDEASIAGDPRRTLGSITTTYVFKSDLFRNLLLPWIGYRPSGESICIDELGRPIALPLPWYGGALAAFGRSVEILEGSEIVIDDRDAFHQGDYLTDKHVPRPPSIYVAKVINEMHPFVRPFLPMPKVQLAILAVASVISACLAIKLGNRDYRYHSITDSYGKAVERRRGYCLPFAYEEWGRKVFSENSFAEAVKYFDAAISLASRSASLSYEPEWSTRINRAVAYCALGAYDKAIVDLTRILEGYKLEDGIIKSFEPRHSVESCVTILQRRAVAYENAGEYDRAMDDYSAIISIRPNVALKYFFGIRAQAERNVGRIRNFMSVFSKSQEEILNAEHKRLTAVAEQAFFDSMSRVFSWAHRRKAICASKLKQFSSAIAEATKAIELNPNDSDTLCLRGWAYYNSMRPEDAARDFSAAIELDPNNANLYYDRARFAWYRAQMKPLEVQGVGTGEFDYFLIAKGGWAAIGQDLRRALELDPSHENAQLLLHSWEEAVSLHAKPAKRTSSD
jgi:tetratricopeptide (TPR) repeat protein